METKIPKTKREAYAQLDEMLSEEDKSAIMNGAHKVSDTL